MSSQENMRQKILQLRTHCLEWMKLVTIQHSPLGNHNPAIYIRFHPNELETERDYGLLSIGEDKFVKDENIGKGLSGYSYYAYIEWEFVERKVEGEAKVEGNYRKTYDFKDPLKMTEDSIQKCLEEFAEDYFSRFKEVRFVTVTPQNTFSNIEFKNIAEVFGKLSSDWTITNRKRYKLQIGGKNIKVVKKSKKK